MDVSYSVEMQGGPLKLMKPIVRHVTCVWLQPQPFSDQRFIKRFVVWAVVMILLLLGLHAWYVLFHPCSLPAFPYSTLASPSSSCSLTRMQSLLIILEFARHKCSKRWRMTR